MACKKIAARGEGDQEADVSVSWGAAAGREGGWCEEGAGGKGQVRRVPRVVGLGSGFMCRVLDDSARGFAPNWAEG